MAYIGNAPADRFTSIPTVQQFNGDGSTTAFTLSRPVGTDQDLLVSVDGVIQDTAAYAVSNGTTLTFSAAPSTGTANIFVNYLGVTIGSVVHPASSALAATTGAFSGKITADAGIDIDNINIDGTTIALSSGDLTLDVAGDISLDAGGTEIRLKDDGTEFGRFINDSTDFNIQSVVSDKDIKFSGNDGGSFINALVLDMSAAGAATFNSSIIMSGVGSLTEVNGNFTVSGTDADHAGLIMATHAILPAEVGAEASANVIDLGANGNEFKSLYLDTSIITSNELTIATGTNLVIDAEQEIHLDSDSEIIRLRHDGGDIGMFQMTGSNLIIRSMVSDEDMIFKGNDGGSVIDALTLDMSAAGAATFNSSVTENSDERLKSNITTIPDALSKVTEMRGVHYIRKDTGLKRTGLIAQELQKIAPELVSTGEDEMSTLSVSYANVVGYLIEAVKELSEKVETLEAK